MLNLPNTQMLLTRCFGRSLSDQYWVNPHDSDLQWGSINFFRNPFSEDIGDVLLGKATDGVGFDFRTPDTELGKRVACDAIHQEGKITPP